MSANVSFGQNSRFKFGWIILLVLAALMTLGYFSMIFFSLDELVLFAGLAALSLYGFLVIYIPFRRGEKWAWYATWILPIVLVLLAATVPGFAIYYYPAATVCVLGLLLTMRDFFLKRQ
jgi:hypothetical protein